MSEELIIEILSALKIIGPSVILPIMILWITNRNARKQKEKDQEFELKKLKASKELDTSSELSLKRKSHENVLHSALIKILFQVQKLHISLSGKCVDYTCIDNAVDEFQNEFTKQQALISQNQIYLNSFITNRLYKFYNLLGELLVELKEIRDSNQFEIAIASVYNYSIHLAEEIIEIQENLASKRKELKNQFNKLKVPYFKSCCGQEPPPEIKEQYERIRKKKMAIAKELDNLPNEIEQKLELETLNPKSTSDKSKKDKTKNGKMSLPEKIRMSKDYGSSRK